MTSKAPAPEGPGARCGRGHARHALPTSLWLVRSAWVLAAWYWLTDRASWDADLFDTGELVAAGWRLGGSHPPGQVLHALASHAAALIPLGPIPFRVSVVSVLGAIAAALATVGIARDLLPNDDETAGPAATWAPEAAGMAVLLSSPILRQSARPEVYTLALFLTLLSFRHLLRWGHADARSRPKRGAQQHLFWGAAYAGLAANLHPPHALACIAAGFALWLLRKATASPQPLTAEVAGAAGTAVRRATPPPPEQSTPALRDALQQRLDSDAEGRSADGPAARAPYALSSLLGAGAVFLTMTTLSVVYLFARGLRGAPLWGDGTSAAGLLSYLSARAYQMNLAGAAGAEPNVREAGEVLLVGIGPVLLVALAAWPLLRSHAEGERAPPSLRSRIRKQLSRIEVRALLTWTLTVAPAFVTPIRKDNPDTVAYLGPSIALGIALAVVSLARASDELSWHNNKAVPAEWRGFAVLLALLLLVAVPGRLLAGTGFDRATASPRQVLANVMELALEAPPPRSVVVVESDFLASSWMMRQATGGDRPDVRLFVRGLSTSSWHWLQLVGHPALDGQPQRAEGSAGYDRYTAGLLQQALPKVPVALETIRLEQLAMQVTDRARLNHHRAATDAPAAMGPLTSRPVSPTLVRGPFALHGVASTADGPQGHREPLRELVELLHRSFPHSLGDGDRGDRQLAHNVVREHLLRRAERLFIRNQTASGKQDLRAAVAATDDDRLAALLARELDVGRALARYPAAWVTESTPVGRSHFDAGRAGAVWLDAFANEPAAVRILETLSSLGDPRAPLQLGYLALHHGHRDQALTALMATSPALRADPQYQQLAHALARESPK